jgi:hypothetical protein
MVTAGTRAYLARGSKTAHGVDAFDGCDTSVLLGAVKAVLSNGDAIQFATTRDQGAVVITLYSEAGIDKVYAVTGVELQEVCVAVQDVATGA